MRRESRNAKGPMPQSNAAQALFPIRGDQTPVEFSLGFCSEKKALD
jgi:hypothetical protein